MYWFVKNYLCKSSWPTGRSFIHTPAEEEHSLLLLSSQDRFFLGCCSGLFNIILLHCLLCSCTFTPKQSVHRFLWLSVEGKDRHLHLSGIEVSWNSSASLDLISYLSMTVSSLFYLACLWVGVLVELSTRVQLQELRQWLCVPSLPFETGSSPVTLVGFEFCPLTLASLGARTKGMLSLTWLASFYCSSVPWLLSVLSHFPPSWSLKFHPSAPSHSFLKPSWSYLS